MKKLWVLMAAALFVFGLAACGSKTEDTSAEQTASKEVVITASNFKFDQPEYKVKKGEAVKLTFKNDGGNHGLIIKELGVELNSNKKSKVITPDTAGTYEFKCNIMCGNGHNDMVAKLIVEE